MSYQQQNVQAALIMKVNILASVVKQQLMKNLLENKLKRRRVFWTIFMVSLCHLLSLYRKEYFAKYVTRHMAVFTLG